MNEDGLGEYIRERFRELQTSFDTFATQIRDIVGDHAVSIARLQMQSNQQDRVLEEMRREHTKAVDDLRHEQAEALAAARRENAQAHETTGRKLVDLREARRFHLNAWIAGLSVLVGAASTLALFLQLHH